MTDRDRLIEVANTLVRILVIMPEYNSYRDSLIDMREKVIKHLEFQQQNDSLASEFSQPGTLKRFLLKRGFMPHDEADAEAILDSIIKENEQRG